jgi:hypothetical protein
VETLPILAASLSGTAAGGRFRFDPLIARHRLCSAALNEERLWW